MRWVSCIQHTDGFWIFIQFARLCLLIGAFSPFTFRVNIVMCKFDTAILMLLTVLPVSCCRFFIMLMLFSIQYDFGMAGTGCSFLCVVPLLGALVKQAWW